jgi:hypothetical protein
VPGNLLMVLDNPALLEIGMAALEHLTNLLARTVL